MARKSDSSVPAVKEDPQLPATMDAFEQDQGAGVDFSPADMAIPFLVILQSGSPQVKRGDQQIEGASEGDIYNTVTNELYGPDDGIHVIPCGFQKAYVEWRDRESGGGFVAQHFNESILSSTKKDDKGRDILPNGNVIVTTAYHFVILVTGPGSWEKAVISMSSTQLKKSRKWNSLIAGIKMQGKKGPFTPPMFSHIYHLTTTPEKNEKGQWSGWSIRIERVIDDPQLYAEAKLFNEQVKAGKVVTAAPPSQETDTGDVPF